MQSCQSKAIQGRTANAILTAKITAKENLQTPNRWRWSVKNKNETFRFSLSENFSKMAQNVTNGDEYGIIRPETKHEKTTPLKNTRGEAASQRWWKWCASPFISTCKRDDMFRSSDIRQGLGVTVRCAIVVSHRLPTQRVPSEGS